MTAGAGGPNFRRTTVVHAPAAAVWAWVTAQEGINYEIGPYLKMTMPQAFRGKSIGDVSPGTHVGKSFLLLFGILPFGYDDITITAIQPGRMFREESAMTGMRTWIHHRTLVPQNDRTTMVTDEITLAPVVAVPGLTRLLSAVLATFFRYRHRRLRHHFAT